jgi:hypothetical protein
MFHDRIHKRLPLSRVRRQANLYTCYLSYLFFSSFSVLFSCLPQGIQNVPYDIFNETCGRCLYNSCNINIILANLIGEGLFVNLFLQQWVWKVWRDLKVTSGPGIESRWGRGFPYTRLGSEAHPSSWTRGSASLSGPRRWGVTMTTHPLQRGVANRLELYLCLPSVPAKSRIPIYLWSRITPGNSGISCRW